MPPHAARGTKINNNKQTRIAQAKNEQKTYEIPPKNVFLVVENAKRGSILIFLTEWWYVMRGMATKHTSILVTWDFSLTLWRLCYKTSFSKNTITLTSCLKECRLPLDEFCDISDIYQGMCVNIVDLMQIPNKHVHINCPQKRYY